MLSTLVTDTILRPRLTVDSADDGLSLTDVADMGASKSGLLQMATNTLGASKASVSRDACLDRRRRPWLYSWSILLAEGTFAGRSTAAPDVSKLMRS